MTQKQIGIVGIVLAAVGVLIAYLTLTKDQNVDANAVARLACIKLELQNVPKEMEKWVAYNRATAGTTGNLTMREDRLDTWERDLKAVRNQVQKAIELSDGQRQGC